MDPLDQLTRSVAKTIGDGPDHHRRARQRRAVANLSVPPPFDRRWWWLVPLGAAVALALAWARFQPTTTAPLIASAETTATAGAHFTAADQPLPVTFPDRSRVVLAPHASARLSTTSTDRVTLDLERGQLDLTVTPNPARAFSVSAGPFTVDVTGTAFTVDWLPDSATLTVAVSSGRVHVHGGSLGDGTHLSAGQRLTTSPASDTLPAAPPSATSTAPPPATSISPNDTSPSDTSTSPSATTTSPATSTSPSATSTSPTNTSTSPSDTSTSPSSSTASNPPRPTPPRPAPASGWRDLADAGDHDAALAAAERAGFTALLERLDAADLERLAHSARLAGAASPAQDALQTLRRRFPADERAATATFLLGRVALDLSHDPASAATWFAAYLDAHPRGPLAADARGRRLQILHDLGDVKNARAAATEYLQHHPNGNRSGLARKILGTP